MSSILRALKKLENEPRHLDGSRSLDSKFVTLADTDRKRPVSSIFMMVIGGGIVCGLVILTGWWFLSEEDQPPTAVSKNLSRPVSIQEKSLSRSENFKKEQSETVTEKPSIEAKVAEIPKTVEQAMEAEPAAVEESALQASAPKDTSPVKELRPEEAVLTQETQNLNADKQVARPPEKKVIASYSIPETPTKTMKPEIPKLNDPEMKLQAVTWSKSPQKRIAVINNRILREGEVVSGYFIDTIKQDDVILSQGGTKWKLVFRIK